MSTANRSKGASAAAEAAPTTAASAKQAGTKKAPKAGTTAAKPTPAAEAAPAKSARGFRLAKRAAPKPAEASGAGPRPRYTESRLAQVLMAPVVSEKATLISEKRNQVTFQVMRDATKPEIKAAVELLFKVEVASVQTVVQKGKVKKFGRSMGRRDHVKKAYVALKPGQELNFSGEGA